MEPIKARTPNQIAITGPNRLPTTLVPKRWIANSRVRTAAAIGSTTEARLGTATFNPSTAESTEIAGVITLSPKNSEAPRIPSVTSPTVTPVRLSVGPRRSAVSDMIPPSPLSSARMMKLTYNTDTIIVSVQKTSEITPYTCDCVACTAWLSDVKTACTAYNGLVPMSPYTTPRAPKARAATPAPATALRVGLGSGSVLADAGTAAAGTNRRYRGAGTRRRRELEGALGDCAAVLAGNR